MKTIREIKISRCSGDHPLTMPQHAAFLQLLIERGIGPTMWQMLAESGILSGFLDVIARGAPLDSFASLLKSVTDRWHGRGIVIGEGDVDPAALFAKYIGLPDVNAEREFWRTATAESLGTYYVRLRRVVDHTLPALHVPLRINMPMETGYMRATLAQVLAYVSEAFESGRPVPEKILVPSCLSRSESRSKTYLLPAIMTKFPSFPRVVLYACTVNADGSLPDYRLDSFVPAVPFWIAEAVVVD